MPAWKIGEKIQGFLVDEVHEIPTMNARYWKLTHEATGATLYYSDRDDGQMVFSVGFRTLPEDDTGVFHIIEHSSLDGSESYRLKEPFVNLMKTSMAVDMNAMTYEDKTLYYFISTNQQDFMNMMTVYLDAVFHPLLLSDRRIFEKEAWHLEPDGQDGLRCSGVVFNEMQGHDNQPYEIMWMQMIKQLYPDLFLRFNSGGDPAAIHTLTYDQFRETYQRFYGVDNAIFYLSGKLGLDRELAQIDRVLSAHEPPKYPRPEPAPLQAPVIHPDGVAYYQLGDNEEVADNTHLMLAFVLGDGTHTEEALAFAILSRYLSETTESPLSKAVLDTGIGQDFSMACENTCRQPFAYMILSKTQPEQADAFRGAVIDTLTDLVSKGLDTARLSDLLDNYETDCRRDALCVESGFRIMETLFRTHVQRGKADMPDDLAALRQAFAQDPRYFEKLIQRYILESDHWALTRCVPSRTVSQEKRERMDAWLKQEADRLHADPGAYRALSARMESFHQYLTDPDSPEAEAAIPHLTPSDIDPHVEYQDLETHTIQGNGGELLSLYYPADTNHIASASLLFDLSGVATEDLFYVRCLKDALFDLPVEGQDVPTLTGRRVALHAVLSASIEVGVRGPEDSQTASYLRLVVNAPEERLAGAVALLGDYVAAPVFDRTILRRLFSNTAGLKSRLISRGHTTAENLAEASLTACGVILNHVKGVASYRRMTALADRFDKEADSLIAGLARVSRMLFRTVRPVAFLIGSQAAYATWQEALARLSFGDGSAQALVSRTLDHRTSKGLSIPGEVNYCARVYRLSEADATYSPQMRVVCAYLGTKYFWDEIRAKGGAYGAFAQVKRYGLLALASYRDPRVADTYAVYDRLPDWLEANLPGEEELGSLLVSSLSPYFAPQSPMDKGEAALSRWENGRSAADVVADMAAILHTTGEDFLSFAATVRKLNHRSAGVNATVGGQDALRGSGLFESIQEL
jgi:hypothetical protein